jgi:hypothetical protein
MGYRLVLAALSAGVLAAAAGCASVEDAAPISPRAGRAAAAAVPAPAVSSATVRSSLSTPAGP